jgi:hypothetical protein
LNNGQVTSVSAPMQGLDISQWLLIDTGDFNGDGVWDLMWWRPDTGEVEFWYLPTGPNAASVSGGTRLQAAASPGRIQGNVTLSYCGDLNGDGIGDILWRDYQTGLVTLWLMGGDGQPILNGLPALPEAMGRQGRPGVSGSLEWTLRGLYDMNADGKADVIWQHASDGRVVVWSMDGAQALGFIQYQRAQPENWYISGMGDLNGDGRGDIVWSNAVTGQVQAWIMCASEPAFEQYEMAMGADAAAWQVKAVGDFCAPGCDSVYCKHSENNLVKILTLDGREFSPSSE